MFVNSKLFYKINDNDNNTLIYFNKKLAVVRNRGLRWQKIKKLSNTKNTKMLNWQR